MFLMQMWAWDHFTFLRPTPPPVPLTGLPFPRGLFWADAKQALEPPDDNRYVGCLLFELLVPTQVTCLFYPFYFCLFIYLTFLLFFSGGLAPLC